MKIDLENPATNSVVSTLLASATSSPCRADDPDDPPPVPGYKNIRIYTDESGTHGAPYFGFGSLWMPHERRGDFHALFEGLKKKHGFTREMKWSRIGLGCEDLAKELIAEFFKRPWLMFHSLLIRPGVVDMAHHKDRDEATRKHFVMLLAKKMKYFTDGQKKAFHAVVDPLPSSYKKADEAAHVIIGHTLRRELGDKALIKSLTTRDSKDVPGIQLADLLLGATLAAWQNEITAGPKMRVSQFLAMHLGWPDMRADTWPSESKFNVWYFHDPTTGEPREVQTRPVKLLYPVVPFRRRSRSR